MICLPEGPKMPDFVWRLQSLFAMLETLDTCQREYGDIFRLPYENPDVVCVSSPEGLKKVFTAPSDVLASCQKDSIFELILGQNALVFLEAKKHQSHRQLLMPPLHGESLKNWASDICQITLQVFGKLHHGQVFVAREVMKEVALLIILKVAFGTTESSRIKHLYDLLSKLFADLASPFSGAALVFPQLRIDLGEWSPWGQFIRRVQSINGIIAAEIQSQQQETDGARSGLLSMLVQAKDSHGYSLKNTEIQDELLMLIFAGYETVTSAVVWALYWVQSQPQVWRRIKSEVMQLPDLTDYLAIAQMPYLTAVCQEVLRIYPVAVGSFARRVLQPLDIDGYKLPVGTIISPSIYLAHRRLSVYPDPLNFRPDRFIEQTFSAYEYLPFGGGERRCVGAAFAQLEMKLILVTLLDSIALVNTKPIKPLLYGITMAPPLGLEMIAITERR